MTSNVLATPPHTDDEADTISIDFLFLDLSTCTRCVGTGQSLEAALGAVRQVVEMTGAKIEVRKTQVETAEQARRLRFVASPTIRVNGRDIALELKESSCGSEACADGCGDHIDCRVWTYRGKDSTQAPVGLIVDAILAAIYSGRTPAAHGGSAYELPENLQRFFVGKREAALVPQPNCCPPSEQESCCEPAAKEPCCGPSMVEGCGCK